MKEKEVNKIEIIFNKYEHEATCYIHLVNRIHIEGKDKGRLFSARSELKEFNDFEILEIKANALIKSAFEALEIEFKKIQGE